MVQPLENFYIIASPFGNELELYWELPAERPTNWKVYIFKRSNTNILQDEIDNYFANIDDLSNFNYNGLFVFDNFKSLQNVTAYVHNDLFVKNDLQYYYRAVIRDEESGEYSEALTQTATALPQLEVKTIDGKDVVATALEKLFDTVKNVAGEKAQIGKEIKIFKQYFEETPETDHFVIERVNGSEKISYWGLLKSHIGNDELLGSTDTDVIKATFWTPNGNARRDLLANLIRGYKAVLIQLIKKLGNGQIPDVKIVVEGDTVNPQINWTRYLGVSFVFILEVESEIRADSPEITEIITEMKIEGSDG